MINALVILIVFGAVLYLVSLIPLDQTVKRIIQVVAIVVLAVWAIKTLLPAAGLS